MQTPAEAYQKVKSLAQTDTSDYFGSVAKGTTQGAITGGVIGLLIGYYKHYNLMGSAIAGILIGGVASNFLIKYKNEQ